MSDPRKTPVNTNLTLEEQLAVARKEILAQVQQETAASIAASAQEIIAGIKQAVADAVDLKYRVVVAQLDGNTEEKSESKKWQIFLVILPVALTVGLGAWISYKFDDQKQELGARLALSQEYEKQRVLVYQDCAKNLSLLFQALQILTVDKDSRSAADDSVHDIYECALNHSLYVSDKVNEKLEKVRIEAVAVLQSADKKQSLSTARVEAAIKDSESQMRKELVGTTAPLEVAQ